MDQGNETNPTTESNLIEGPRDTTEGTTRRSTRFWFDDGNVILDAEDRTQFRVHRSVLTLHSEILGDCFSIPQPEDSVLVEGCILVHLPESSTDIENMCSLLYGLYHLDIDNTDSSYLQTMIRLGRKYEINYFKTSALKHLRALFPQTLSAWYSKQPIIASFLKGGDDLFLFHVINLAYESDLMSIVPAAFLSLCTLHSLDEILQVDRLIGGTKTILEMRPLLDCIKGRSTFLHSFLSDLVMVYKPADQTIAARFPYNLPSDRCEHKNKCSKTLQILFGDLITLGTTLMEGKISFTKDMESDFPNIVTALCEDCKSAFARDFHICRTKLWERLPACFNLPAWERMKDFDADRFIFVFGGDVEQDISNTLFT